MKKLLSLLLIPISLFAQQDQSSLLLQFIKGQHDYFRFDGNIIVAKDGKLLCQLSLGYANYQEKTMLSDNSVFEMGSLSKPFTAMGIMICKERGLLRYEDDIRKFFPALPYEHITVWNLLTNTSGLPSYEEQFKMYWDHKKMAFNQDVVEMLQQRKDSLIFKPGTKWQNSNTGYVLLALIIEKISSMGFEQFLSKNLFQPLGMTHTFVYNPKLPDRKIPDNYALGSVYSDSLKNYSFPGSLPAFDFVHYLDGIAGDSRIQSTVGDLLKWNQSLYGNPVISQSTLDEMLSPVVPKSLTDTSNYYGFGLNVQPKSQDGKIISQTGSWPGYRINFTSFTDKKDVIIVLSNNEFNVSFLTAGVESVLDGETLIMPYEHKEVKIDTSLLNKYVGTYTAGLTLEFVKKDGKLFRYRKGTQDIELKPESPTKFFYADGTDRQIEFETDAEGHVIKVWFINTGQKGELRKI
jgi:CubicO group peptidase (beta-lactamase class C family)